MSEEREDQAGRTVESWQRPPFEAGNTAALRHGVFSPRVVDPRAGELVEQLLDTPGLAYLQAPQWRPAVWAWARAEVQVQLLGEYLEGQVGDLGDERVNRAHLLLHRAEARATTGRTRLGLDPLSAARLGRDKTAAALDAAQLMKQLADRERQEAGDGGE